MILFRLVKQLDYSLLNILTMSFSSNLDYDLSVQYSFKDAVLNGGKYSKVVEWSTKNLACVGVHQKKCIRCLSVTVYSGDYNQDRKDMLRDGFGSGYCGNRHCRHITFG